MVPNPMVVSVSKLSVKVRYIPGGRTQSFYEQGVHPAKEIYPNIILGKGPTQKHQPPPPKKEYKYSGKALIIVQKLQSDGNSI